MAAASVLIPLSVINQNGGVLPPSALSQQTPRHGRSRGMSVNGKSAGGKGYRVVENADATVAKAVAFVLKRAVSQDELDSEVEDDYLICDTDGWVGVADLLEQPRMKDLGITLNDIHQSASSSKARFTLRQKPESDTAKAESYQVRRESKRDSASQAPLIPEGEPLKADTENLPEYIVYETTYQNYPLVIASGTIKKADGASHLSFLPVAAATATSRPSKADVSIWIHLRTAMEQAPELKWQFTTSGRIVTIAEELPQRLWKKAVARRPDIGLLFEDGVVHKEIPEGLRGKGAKGKAKKGKGMLRQEGQGRADSESDSVEESVEEEV
ncbi:putative tRNA 2'-phosphotransferase 1 [Xylaria bambusicola]|uniref:putative tRNA 2'-phosphotransferase 1 n=1 Tax=Xylaria bambusicola TaxID=326684 RepID=UPI002008D479|nr:putative tRNA 2'-phosphotransferase 1 [Xylaria bambusicola]KAI0509378.1 putative tRNA 2'-phosphotransferase 1 [Xylaria bambusicola]